MVRGKIQLKRIENATSRQVTFSKRRNGLLKKAYELSVLCEVEVAAIIFSQKGRLYEFSSSDIQMIIERYRNRTKGGQLNNIAEEQYIQQLRSETAIMEKKIGLLDVSQRQLFGYGLSFCNSEELQEMENQLVRSLHRIRERKARILMDRIKHLKEKERLILEEKARISGKCGAKDQHQLPGDQEKDIVTLNQQEEES
ncbi:MADS-box protein AGL42-like isoform X1 [Juglans microcarpa x Juglans regia]|uniref:MADS-box protein AGL42-like isoform X1 n=1 Tax=Juglans microcarpa x Juglans regia TaxID=2249226 RepID=UPI001B7E069E|nr:MADS-box protein AGL42-like isoform X1 [Juglans microcarpa x Juglans regia]